MVDLIAALPGMIGYVVGSGIWLFLLSRALLTMAPTLRQSGSRLFVAHGLVLVVAIVVISQASADVARDAALNAVAALLLWSWDYRRLRKQQPAAVSPGLAGHTTANVRTPPSSVDTVWTAWNNGAFHQTGSGFGFKIPATDRDRLFDRAWKTVIIELPDQPEPTLAVANIDKDSFWGAECRELISQAIGRWFLQNGYAPWPSGAPPKFSVQATGGGRFVVGNRHAA
jgi:hypothetical protein